MGSPVLGESDAQFTPGISGKNVAPFVAAGLGSGEGRQGVRGESLNGPGVEAISHGGGPALKATSNGGGPALLAFAGKAPGIHTLSGGSEGIRADSSSAEIPAIVGNNMGFRPDGTPGGAAARFKGDVTVIGDILLEGADYAEELSVADTAVAPGMVVVLDEDGRLRPCLDDYDQRIAGIVSGGKGVRSALVLDRHPDGAAVALMGKVWVFADADLGPIHCGDLLTSASTPGHARCVTDQQRAFGALLGKALTKLESGQDMVRVLVNGA